MPRRKCPKGTICIENYTMVIIFVLLLVIGYYVYKNNFCKTCNHIEPNSALKDTPLFSQLLLIFIIILVLIHTEHTATKNYHKFTALILYLTLHQIVVTIC